MEKSEGGANQEGRQGRRRPLLLSPDVSLDAMGKLLEYLILGRLEQEMEERGGLAENQYGFRKGRSTVGAINKIVETAKSAKDGKNICAMVTVDIKNAFNSAGWEIILRKVRRMGLSPYLQNILRSYLEDRWIGLEAENIVRWEEVTCGVPQGSILGPTLWNLLFDGIFRLDYWGKVTVVGYADDLAVMVIDKYIYSVRETANSAIKKIGRWLNNRGLKIQPSKSEVIVLAGRRKLEPLQVMVGDTLINESKSIKYLGVWIDPSLSFGLHIAKTAEKASRIATALAKVMANTYGPKASKRRVLCSVVHSVMLYAAPVWHTALEAASTRQKLSKVQRHAAMRICSAYRTISHEAALVLAGTPPITLMARERADIYLGMPKDMAREILWREWQQAWEETSKARWTKSLIREIRPWVERGHGETGYHLTQLLTGHGSFREYLYDINKIDSRECIYCGENDDARHTLFDCRRWKEWRTETENKIGTVLTEENLIRLMLKKEKYWSLVQEMSVRIMSTKESDEREYDPNP